MERDQWDDDGEFSLAPLPPHERAWRHPSELGAEAWTRSEPPLRIGRGLLSAVAVLCVTLVGGLAWALAATSLRPGRGAEDVAAPGNDTASAAWPTPTVTGKARPARRAAVGSPTTVRAPRPTSVAATTAPARSRPSIPVPTTIATAAPTRRPRAQATVTSPESQSTVVEEIASTTMVGVAELSPFETAPETADQPGAAVETGDTEPAASGEPGTADEPGADIETSSVHLAVLSGRFGSAGVTVVPVLDGSVGVALAVDRLEPGAALRLRDEHGEPVTGTVVVVGDIALLSLSPAVRTDTLFNPLPAVDAPVTVVVDGVGYPTTARIDSASGWALDLADCPTGAPVLDENGLVGFCRGGEVGAMMAAMDIETATRATKLVIERLRESMQGTTPPTPESTP